MACPDSAKSYQLTGLPGVRNLNLVLPTRILTSQVVGCCIPEVARLFAYSYSNAGIANETRSPDKVIGLVDEAGIAFAYHPFNL